MPPRHRSFAQVAVTMALGSLVSSCASFTPVTLPTAPGGDATAIAASVHPGDRVRLLLTDRRVTEFTVAAVERDALVGQEGERVAYTEIARLERRSVGKTKTVFLIASPLLALGGLLLILIIANPPF